MVRLEPDPATPHGGNSWKPLTPLFPIQKGGQQLVCPLLGLAPFTGKRLTRKAFIVPRRVLDDLHNHLWPKDFQSLRTQFRELCAPTSSGGNPITSGDFTTFSAEAT